MFILPVLLFFVASYIRIRTVAQLSYLAGAIELTSGLLSLLISPLPIQICILICLFFTHNRLLLTSLGSTFAFDNSPASFNRFANASTASSALTLPAPITVDVEAQAALESLPQQVQSQSAAAQASNPQVSPPHEEGASLPTVNSTERLNWASPQDIEVQPPQTIPVRQPLAQLAVAQHALSQHSLTVLPKPRIYTYRGVTYTKLDTTLPKPQPKLQHQRTCTYRGVTMTINTVH